jgi:uncharacterized membrane protein YdbT with pleckstrin-like domain
MPLGSIKTNFQNSFKNVDFKGKRPDEEIILLLRRHWVVFVFKFIPFLLIFIGLLILHFGGIEVLEFLNLSLSKNWFYLVENFLWLFFWLSVFIVWINFYLDVWIVTDNRIVNIEQLGLFSRHISELKHNKIQDVTSEVQGLIPTLFGYGNVYIQTAGNKQRFVFKQIPESTETRNIIMQLQKRALFEEKKKEGEILRGKV